MPPREFPVDTIEGPLTASDFAHIRSVRLTEPAAITHALDARRRRPLAVGDNRLFIIAADHPARGALGVGDDAMAMANRYDLLQRLALALSRPGVDGVLGTPDIIEDLAILGVLDDKIAVGSMNRGGLRGAVFEMDDRYTSYDIDSIAESGLDFAKLLLRINLADQHTASTLERTARAVTHAAERKLPIMIEPFISEWADGHIHNDLSAEAVIISMAIAAGLGASSAYTWLKLPVVPQMERVMQGSTLPTLLLGGDLNGRPDETYRSWEHALALPGVHGLVVGRTILYPADGDVAGVVDTAARLVHA
ncbi:class I fructose-bisphosphate aldolase [Rathayibacter soli]|uniref:class I fructose-bisphosphate aldolase n=1 Tax=Rathayibacter soli TaxID=3144168 RepID=UPI0027E4AC8F|nr:deoxyribose-phosphate aldolase [Glaciibacter superstes]